MGKNKDNNNNNNNNNNKRNFIKTNIMIQPTTLTPTRKDTTIRRYSGSSIPMTALERQVALTPTQINERTGRKNFHSYSRKTATNFRSQFSELEAEITLHLITKNYITSSSTMLYGRRRSVRNLLS